MPFPTSAMTHTGFHRTNSQLIGLESQAMAIVSLEQRNCYEIRKD